MASLNASLDLRVLFSSRPDPLQLKKRYQHQLTLPPALAVGSVNYHPDVLPQLEFPCRPN